MKVVSATQAKNNLGALIGSLKDKDEAVVIERHGHPRAVIISADEWAALLQEREALRRLQAWERIRQLAEEVAPETPTFPLKTLTRWQTRFQAKPSVALLSASLRGESQRSATDSRTGRRQSPRELLAFPRSCSLRGRSDAGSAT
jgi:prevent-host-death family protein